jgi:hypothetical protein
MFEFRATKQSREAIGITIFKYFDCFLNQCFVAFVALVFGVLQFLEFFCFQNILQKLEQQEQQYFITIIYAVNKNKNKE